jgi:hypothetical protein
MSNEYPTDSQLAKDIFLNFRELYESFSVGRSFESCRAYHKTKIGLGRKNLSIPF